MPNTQRKPKTIVDYAQEAARYQFGKDKTLFEGSFLEGDLLRKRSLSYASTNTLISCNRNPTWRLVAQETYSKAFIIEYERLVKDEQTAKQR